MIFPKCMIGRNPFVTCHGYLMPCCWLDVPRYNSKNKILNNDGEWIKNEFLKFDLNQKSYKETVNSDEWLLSLEKLFLLNYYNCNTKCKNYVTHNDKITHNEFLIDDLIRENNISFSYDINFFNKNVVDTWECDDIQLELTNKCSLKCSYCARLYDKPNKSDLSINIVDDILKCKHWKNIEDVGSYGDTMFYKPYHTFLKLLGETSVDNYSGHFASTGKGKKWWDETFLLYNDVIKSGTNIRLTFGIDGLEDTSKFHRIGQDWDEITYALKKSVEAGCDVFWQYIPMSFNEHQINEAKKLAEEWGCKFHLCLSDRFRKNDPNRPKSSNLYRTSHAS